MMRTAHLKLKPRQAAALPDKENDLKQKQAVALPDKENELELKV